ncbi:hypothetical protein LAT59_02105 [Candidatus Gracilibacteria bacterium]|nr:hypothetical protein [Candidatus Gracilibacteria bacterium]
MLNIALNTFKEIVRNRFLYLIVFFAFVFILFSIILGKLTIGESDKVIVDFGIAMIEIFGLIGVLFVGSQLLFKEVEGKTIFLILSKPITRQDFILGKYFGFSGVILLLFIMQSLLFLGVLFFQEIVLESLILLSLLFTLWKLLILLAIVFFLSTFMTPMLTIIVSLMIFVVSHSFSLLLTMFARISEILFMLVQGVQLLFPPLEALNIKDVIGTFEILPPLYFISNTFYTFTYIAFLLFFTVLIFSRKNFEE